MKQSQIRRVRRYGPWAIVAGASEGLGEAFARVIASSGVNVVIAARRIERLEQLAESIRDANDVLCEPMQLDLASEHAIDEIEEATGHLDVGLFVYNAAFSPGGRIETLSEQDVRATVAVNCFGPLEASRRFAIRFARREHAGIILMSSMAGLQGTACLAAYAASKSFMRVLAESMWAEMRGGGIDVVGCVAGAVDTPGYQSDAAAGGSPAPVLSPERVARSALNALGKRPVTIPGAFYPIMATLMQRILPKRVAIELISRSTRKIYDATNRR